MHLRVATGSWCGTEGVFAFVDGCVCGGAVELAEEGVCGVRVGEGHARERDLGKT